MKRFFVVFAMVALVLAGAVSYLADGNPDGLDAVTRNGCTAVEAAGEELLQGNCVAQNAEKHALASSPFAGYTIGGDSGLTGLAGLLGVLVTLVVVGGLCWLLRTRRDTSG